MKKVIQVLAIASLFMTSNITPGFLSKIHKATYEKAPGLPTQEEIRRRQEEKQRWLEERAKLQERKQLKNPFERTPWMKPFIKTTD